MARTGSDRIQTRSTGRRHLRYTLSRACDCTRCYPKRDTLSAEIRCGVSADADHTSTSALRVSLRLCCLRNYRNPQRRPTVVREPRARPRSRGLLSHLAVSCIPVARTRVPRPNLPGGVAAARLSSTGQCPILLGVSRRRRYVRCVWPFTAMRIAQPAGSVVLINASTQSLAALVAARRGHALG